MSNEATGALIRNLRKEADPEGVGAAPVCDRPGGVQMGERTVRP